MVTRRDTAMKYNDELSVRTPAQHREVLKRNEAADRKRTRKRLRKKARSVWIVAQAGAPGLGRRR
jgi:hypothetical protein